MLQRLIPSILQAREPDPVALLSRDMAGVRDATIAFHLAADYIDTPFHVTMWAPHLDDAGISWYVICRERHHLAALRRAGIRSVLAPKPHHLPLAVAPGVRAVLYANNANRNIEMIRHFPDLVHVQMLHGDSDKPPSYSPVTANFDQIFVAGQLGRDRYSMNGVTIPDDAFVQVGRPQVKDRPVGPRPGWREKPVVAYMPTWIGGQADAMFSSLDRGADIIRAIRAESPAAEILFKPHPLSYKDPCWPKLEQEIGQAMAETGAVAINRTGDANQVYDRSDLLVTDISSTMSDFLYSDRPLAVILPKRTMRNQAKAFPTLGGCYQASGNLGDLADRLRDALGPDSLAPARHAMRKYAFGAHDGPADARFIEAVRRLAGEGHG